jgi:hypothetical protein
MRWILTIINNGVRMDVDEDEDEEGGSLSKMVKKKVAKKQGRKRMEEAEARTRVEDAHEDDDVVFVPSKGVEG